MAYNNTLNKFSSGGFRMRKRMMTLAVVAVCLTASACNDDGPVKPPEFAVTIEVKDTAGDPVEGLRVGLVNDHAYFQDGGFAAKASTRIPYSVAIDVNVRFTIEDIEGREIRTEEFPASAGYGYRMWDGKNDAGVYQPSGRYTAHFVATNVRIDLWVFEDRTDMLMSLLDSSRVPTGYTDVNGKVVLRDRTLFPHLYDRPELTATDENGQIMGVFNVTPLMRISLVDTVSGKYMNFKEDVLEGATLNLTWDPPLASEARGDEPAAPASPGVAKIDTTQAELFELGLAYPNPFN